jgi:UV excision repair protein RAD23
MKITIKTTQQKVFHVCIPSISPSSLSHILLQVDLDGEETIAVLKAKIHESQGHPVAVQKIIYSGAHPPQSMPAHLIFF